MNNSLFLDLSSYGLVPVKPYLLLARGVRSEVEVTE